MNNEQRKELTKELEDNGIESAVQSLNKYDYRDYCLFNADVAESVLHIYEKDNDDKAPRLAIQGVRDWHAGKITDEDLKKRSDAAYASSASASAYAYDAYASAAAASASSNATYDASAAASSAARAEKWNEIEQLFIKHFTVESGEMKVLSEVREILGEAEEGHEWSMDRSDVWTGATSEAGAMTIAFRQRPIEKTIDLQTVLDAGLDLELFGDHGGVSRLAKSEDVSIDVSKNHHPFLCDGHHWPYCKIRIPQLIERIGPLEIEGVELELIRITGADVTAKRTHFYKVIKLKPSYKYEWEKS